MQEGALVGMAFCISNQATSNRDRYRYISGNSNVGIRQEIIDIDLDCELASHFSGTSRSDERNGKHKLQKILLTRDDPPILSDTAGGGESVFSVRSIAWYYCSLAWDDYDSNIVRLSGSAIKGFLAWRQ